MKRFFALAALLVCLTSSFGYTQTFPSVTPAANRASASAVGIPILKNALSTTVFTVKSTPGRLDAYFCYNPDTVVNYVQIFDVSGSVTLGTTTPKWSIGIPASGGANLSNLNLGFANAIKVAATTTATGSSAPAVAVDCNFGVR